MTQKTEGQPFTLPGQKFSFLAYAQLLRLPNVFTAMADICMAALAVGALPVYWFSFGLILLASCCLYLAGMVWNDVFDLDEDKRDRSYRPLPSGRVPLKNALCLGVFLLGAGIALAAIAGQRSGVYDSRSLIVAGLLAVNILFYDAMLKHTLLGPVGMGGCRFLNVMLGLSIVPGTFVWPGYVLAMVVGLYIAGVTWFARTEATTSNRQFLSAAAFVMIVALLLSLVIPDAWPREQTEEARPWHVVLNTAFGLLLFPYMLAGFALFGVLLPTVRAVRMPTPQNVQFAVKCFIMGLVVFDALLATALAGIPGLFILLLLVPALVLGRFVYST